MAKFDGWTIGPGCIVDIDGDCSDEERINFGGKVVCEVLDEDHARAILDLIDDYQQLRIASMDALILLQAFASKSVKATQTKLSRALAQGTQLGGPEG